jgi:hypothetical protein
VVVQPPRTYDASDGFDFRVARLDPAVVGTERLCVLGSIDGSAAICRSQHAGSHLELTAPASASLTPGDVLRVRVDAEGERMIAARATLIERVGRLEDPPPPSRCDCDDEPEPEPPPPRPAGYDFRRIWDDKAWNTTQICDVIRVDEVMRSAPDAREYSPGSYFDPSVAPYAADVWCRSKTGSERIVLGASSYQLLLGIEDDDVLDVRLTHAGSNRATAIYERQR